MGKLIGSEVSEEVRPFEPDFSDNRRNPWDPEKHPKNYAYIQSLIEKIDELETRPVKYPPEIKLRVYALRDEGCTLRQIAEKVNISKSTACLYLQKREKENTETYCIQKPGTSEVVEREVTIHEVNVGKLKPKKK